MYTGIYVEIMLAVLLYLVLPKFRKLTCNYTELWSKENDRKMVILRLGR